VPAAGLPYGRLPISPFSLLPADFVGVAASGFRCSFRAGGLGKAVKLHDGYFRRIDLKIAYALHWRGLRKCLGIQKRQSATRDGNDDDTSKKYLAPYKRLAC
jgi:hypothetical protein